MRFIVRAVVAWAGLCLASQNSTELRWSIYADPKTFDPLLAAEGPSETVAYLTGGVLMRLNRATFALEPELAEAWKVSPDGKRIDFTLRRGVQFSDGSAFGPADVVASVRRLSDLEIRSAVADTFRAAGGEISARATGAASVVVSFAKPRADLVDLFDQLAITSAKSGPTGAVLGPFMIDRYEAGSFVLLRSNPHYWKTQSGGGRLPHAQTIRLEVRSSRDAEVARFRRNEIDLIDKVEPEAFERLRKDWPAAVRDLGASLDAEFLWFNQSPSAPIAPHRRRWFGSKRFRQAISRAINRDDIARLVYLGHAQVAAGPVSPANRIWYNAALPKPVYEPEGALKLLQAEGFRLNGKSLEDASGNRVEFSLVTNAGSQTRTRIGAIIQQDLAKIGVHVNFTPLEFQSLIERISQTQAYEACLLGLTNTEPDPNKVMNVWLSSGTHHAWNPGQPKPATDWEAEIDRLVQLQASALRTATRKAAMDRVQAIFAEQVPIVYIVYPNVLAAVSPSLRGASPSVLPPHLFWNIEHVTTGSSTQR